MTRRCVYCPVPHNYAVCPPYDDERVTHGMCETAAAIEHAKLDAAGYPPAPLFFGGDVVKTSPLADRLMTKPHWLPPIRPEWPRNPSHQEK